MIAVGKPLHVPLTAGLVQVSVFAVSDPDTAHVPVQGAPAFVVALNVNVPENPPLLVVAPVTVPFALAITHVPFTLAPACVKANTIATRLFVVPPVGVAAVYCIVPLHEPATLVGATGVGVGADVVVPPQA